MAAKKTDKKKAEAPRKSRRAKKKGGESSDAVQLSVATHPRASRQVRLAKGFGGLAGFLATGYLSLSAGVPLVATGERALACGVIGYLLAWACSVSLWRQLMLAELRAHQERAVERAAERPTGALPLPDGAVAAAASGAAVHP